jgi:hypothetical protein
LINCFPQLAITFLTESCLVGLGYQRIKVLAWNLSGWAEENHEKPIRIAGALADT